MLIKVRPKTKLDIEIELKFDELRVINANDEAYDRVLAQLERLYKMNEIQNSNRVSADTWALIGANLLGIVIIITHEYTNPITTKAMQFALKPK